MALWGVAVAVQLSGTVLQNDITTYLWSTEEIFSKLKKFLFADRQSNRIFGDQA